MRFGAWVLVPLQDQGTPRNFLCGAYAGDFKMVLCLRLIRWCCSPDSDSYGVLELSAGAVSCARCCDRVSVLVLVLTLALCKLVVRDRVWCRCWRQLADVGGGCLQNPTNMFHCLGYTPA